MKRGLKRLRMHKVHRRTDGWWECEYCARMAPLALDLHGLPCPGKLLGPHIDINRPKP